MPNNENNYRIRSEFSCFLRGLPGFRISDVESFGFISVVVSPIRIPRYRQNYLTEQLLIELEKDLVNREELIRIGRIFKKYLLLIKQIDIERTYYNVTPGMMAGLFIILHLSQLFFPANKVLIYGGLITDLYSLGFWLFSIWSFSQHERALISLESKLMEKINLIKSLSVQIDSYYLESSSSRLPSYNDVLLEDSIRASETFTLPMVRSSNTPNFFMIHERERDADNTDPRSERCYSII